MIDAKKLVFEPPALSSRRVREIVNLLRNPTLIGRTPEEQLLKQIYDRVDLPPEFRHAVGLRVDFNVMKSALERLPVHTDQITTPENQWIGFILVAGEWWPLSILNIRPNGMWIEYRCDDCSGCSSGVARWPEWAHATADNAPNLEWPPPYLVPGIPV